MDHCIVRRTGADRCNCGTYERMVMPKTRKLQNPEIRAKAEELLKTCTRAQVCKELGVDYNMLRREFGNCWSHKVGETVKVEGEASVT